MFLEIIFGIFISLIVIDAPIALRKRSFEIEHGYFKHICVGKFSVFLGGSKKDPINKFGIIKPFLVMSIVSYVLVLLLWIGYILILTIIHDESLKNKIFIVWSLMCTVGTIFFDLILFFIMMIISKKRSKKLENKKYKSFLDR